MDIQIPYNFNPYPYQFPLYNARSDGFDRGFAVQHRRAGKDKVFMNILAREIVKRKGTYFYILPYYKQARMIIWEGVDNDGFRFIEHIPPQLVSRKENQQMVLETKVGSVIRFLGSDNIDSIVGTNPVGVLFSEYPLHKPQAWNYLRPILAQNRGWAFFNGTPRGKNHAYKLYRNAVKDPTWFTETLTIRDTEDWNHQPIVTEAAIQRERDSGMPPELIQQEFYCSWDAGMTGSYYTDLLKNLQEAVPCQINRVPYEPSLPVSTAWDLGMNDDTCIWFFQQYQRELRLIDYYSDRSKALSYYLGYCLQKGYNYDYHIFPFDINVKELSTGKSRLSVVRNFNPVFRKVVVAPKPSIVEGINIVRQLLPRCWFDEVKCSDGIESLRNYRRDFDEKNNVFRKNPAHDEFSHGADAFRMLALGIREVPTPEQNELLKQQHAIGLDKDPYEVSSPYIVNDWSRRDAKRFSEEFSNPQNQDPFQTVTGNSQWGA